MAGDLLITSPEAAFSEFGQRFSGNLHRQLMDRLETEIGATDNFGSTPLFLTRDQYTSLASISEAYMELLLSPEYYQKAAANGYTLPQQPLNRRDLIGGVDFFLNGDQARVIEVNVGPTGRVGFTDIIDRFWRETYQWDLSPDSPPLMKPIIHSVSEGGQVGPIAVAVSTLEKSRLRMPHYQYVAKCFRDAGVDAEVVVAEEVEEGPVPKWNGKTYARIFNLVLPQVWSRQLNDFPNFTRAFQRYPQYFYPNPFGARMGDKSLQSFISNQQRAPLGVDENAWKSIRDTTPKSVRLREAKSFEEVADLFGGWANTVLKPVGEYMGKGLILHPSEEQARTIWDTDRDRYITQEFFEPERHPYFLEDGTVEQWIYGVRVEVVEGKTVAMRAYAYPHAKTKFRLVPVLIV